MDRKEAKANGLKTYNSGTDCVNGHTSPDRYTCSGTCVKCMSEGVDKEKKKEYDKKRNSEKREYILERCREYYQKNKIRISKRNAEWAKNNKDKVCAIKKNYKHRRRSKELIGVSSKELADFIDNENKVCFYCDTGCQDSFHIDHIIPLSKGGCHELYNMCISCPECNIRKNSTDPEVFVDRILSGYYDE